MLASSGRQPTDLADGERWFVVFTLPHQEKRAQTQLENQSYRTFLPKREKTVRHARKLTTVVAPFFPRYMFIILDPEHDQWRPVNGTLGVSRLVMQGERPNPVPPGIVETLVASTGPDGLLATATSGANTCCSGSMSISGVSR